MKEGMELLFKKPFMNVMASTLLRWLHSNLDLVSNPHPVLHPSLLQVKGSLPNPANVSSKTCG